MNVPLFPSAIEEKTIASKPEVLIAGVGNILLGDDGFGVVVAQQLMKNTDIPDWAKIIETGIGGMSLVQELMYGYDALIIVDAYARGGKPGQLYLLEPILPDLSKLDPLELRTYFADTHYATPIRALSLLAHISKPPKVLRILGCEPDKLDDMKIGLSPAVADAADRAISTIGNLLDQYPKHGFGEVASNDKTMEVEQWRPKSPS